MMRFSALVGLMFLAVTGRAFAVGSLGDVSIYDRTGGRLLPVYSADDRYYVPGRTGSEYEIRIRNTSGSDLLAVVSVDGVNVVSGETASPSQGGYVIGAGRSVTIAGWRKSMSRVAAFYFTDHSDAYATRTGRPNDVGVIGVALFRRKTPPPVALDEVQPPRSMPYPGAERREAPGKLEGDAERDRAAGSPSQNAQRSEVLEKSIGTGHGRSETSQARYVTFERESDTPNEVIVIGYDTQTNLVARGIIPARSARDPNPFPAPFVPDPPAR